MKQQIKVVMLPTEDYILKCVLKGNTHGRLVINMNRDLPQKFRETFTPQHLYITISQDIEPIKEGDWCIHLMQNVHDDMDTTHVFQAGVISEYENRKTVNNTDKTFYFEYECRKIIATDDPKLLKEHDDSVPIPRMKSTGIAKLQQSFLKEFVANPDGEWEVEYEASLPDCPRNRCSIPHCSCVDVLTLKLNKDNTVNITSVKKKMYSREQMIDAYETGYFNATSGGNGNTQSQEDWIRENLLY